MTILFTGSKQGDKERYVKVINVLNELGHQVKTRNLFRSTDTKNSFKRELEQSDLMVSEVTDISLALGLEIATALSKNKHVIILTTTNKSLDDLSEFLRENSSKYSHILTYTENSIEEVLSKEFKKAKKYLNFVLHVELPSKYGGRIENIQKYTNKTKKDIVEEALIEYLPQIENRIDKSNL